MANNENFETKNETTEKQANDSKNMQQEIDQKIDNLSKNDNSNEDNIQDVQRLIRKNIEKTISEYNDNQYKIGNEYKQNNLYKIFQGKNIKFKKDSLLIKIVKLILTLFLISMISCLIVSFSVMSKVDAEKAAIKKQIDNAEKWYYAFHKKYHYFSKTPYDSVLEINLNDYKYFNCYEVLPKDETSNYEIKLYGATNIFAITYHTIRAFF